jgi:2-C-methyl-D-erythritol 4-phosphate cytidylyltransferase/2-C-methyl-D-erythritol 2,4-cyclodiphosphate synthase
VDSPKILGIVVAAGGAVRFGGETPKQFQDLAGRSVLEHSIQLLASHPGVDGVVVVLASHVLASAIGQEVRSIPGVLAVVAGGATRAESVLEGVKAAADAEYVLVHDAARPTAGLDLVSRVIDATVSTGAAIPAISVNDTCKEISSTGRVVRTQDRDLLRAAQTPQGARTDWIREALKRAIVAGVIVTDESSALEAAGRPVQVVDGDRNNLKITTQEDLELLRRRMEGEQRGMRIGTGFDVHRFGGAGPLMLGGVQFDGEGLDGHSDADVVLHAVMDAVLGAAALGDIGRHFPPDDNAWKGADSGKLTREVAEMVRNAGYEIENVDLTVLAERPRIGVKVDEMRNSIAACLGLAAGQVSVKATTFETMGALGRGEGIGCQAVALLHSPAASGQTS